MGTPANLTALTHNEQLQQAIDHATDILQRQAQTIRNQKAQIDNQTQKAAEDEKALAALQATIKSQQQQLDANTVEIATLRVQVPTDGVKTSLGKLQSLLGLTKPAEPAQASSQAH